MTDKVRRYSASGHERDDVAWMLYTDHARLLAERDARIAELEALLPPSEAGEGDKPVAARECPRCEGEYTETCPLCRYGEKVGPMDRSAPERVWLQIYTDGDNEDRSEAIPRECWSDLTWCYESIGGQEVVYIRQDLTATPPAAEVDDAAITKALNRAFCLGQTYWQQADSEFTSQHKKADVTMAKFKQLVTDTTAALRPFTEESGNG